MLHKLVFILLIFVSFSPLNAMGQSGDVKMNEDVWKLITDLNLDPPTRKEFIQVYREYGFTMKSAVEKDASLLELYFLFKASSKIRDDKMKEILSSEKYSFYRKRQKEIDDRAGERYRKK